jgi:hypothetical protein
MNIYNKQSTEYDPSGISFASECLASTYRSLMQQCLKCTMQCRSVAHLTLQTHVPVLCCCRHVC